MTTAPMPSAPGEPDTELLAAIQQDARLSAVEAVRDGEWLELSRNGLRVAVVGRDACMLGPALENVSRRTLGLLFVGDKSEERFASLPARAIAACLEDGYGPETLFRTLEGLFHRLALVRDEFVQDEWVRRFRRERDELIEVARALSQERDLDRLLALILERTRKITGADAGSIYVVDNADAAASPQLRFKTSQNESVEFESSEFTVPVSMQSIAGAAALTREPINIPDVQAIGDSEPYRYDASFDEKIGYQTRSMIAVPMISAEDDVIGVIQLINKKRHSSARLTSARDFETDVIPFDEHSEEFLSSLASQAGIALENALLYSEIQRIFEGFVRASVQAIEQRDPTTSGHSARVSVLTCRLAEVVDAISRGPYADQRFSRSEMQELEYAALLHDFGKIGVREQVLVKAKKLYPHELEAIKARFAHMLKDVELDLLRTRIALLENKTPDAGCACAHHEAENEAQRDAERRRGRLSGALMLVLQANEPTVLSEGDFSAIRELANETYRDAEGETRPWLEPSEVHALQVTKGSLCREELKEIRGHVNHTMDFLSRHSLGQTMARIPQIAGAHHEKLDGTGYPLGLKAAAIPVQSKIMSIADIFDALTARDRPYKRAVPLDRALRILGMEVADGHLDAELVRLFLEARVYEILDAESP